MFSCNNPAQNTLLNDTSISIKDGAPQFWLSKDIILTSSSNEPDIANVGQNNTVTVLVRKESNFPGTQFVTTQLWVANPSLNIAPNVNAVEVQPTGALSVSAFQPHPQADPGQTIAEFKWNWTAQESLSNSVPTDPDPNKLHRCLIARTYPSDLTPPETKFCVVEDRHLAQRNITIIKLPGIIRRLSFPIQTISQSTEVIQSATIRTIADRVPTSAVIEAILPSLQQVEGFRQFAQVAPKGFGLQIADVLSPVIRDNSRIENISPITPGDIPFRDNWRHVFTGGFNFGRFREIVFNPNIVLQQAVAVQKFNSVLNVNRMRGIVNTRLLTGATAAMTNLVERAAPTFEADIQLPPQQVANFTFTADIPETSQPGDAHIFHVMHIDDQQQVIGGLTIVAVVT
jgi:hypothetical protein